MAKAHVLDSVGALTRVAFHFTVPAGNNTAGVTWVSALLNSAIPKTTALPDGTGSNGTISSAEKTSITNGTVFEEVDQIEIPPGLNTTQANAFLDAHHASQQTQAFELFQRRLRYQGFTRT